MGESSWLQEVPYLQDHQADSVLLLLLLLMPYLPALPSQALQLSPLCQKLLPSSPQLLPIASGLQPWVLLRSVPLLLLPAALLL